MKKLMLFIAIVIATGTISVYANGEKVHLKVVFEAVDAKGNRDTAEFAIRDKATNSLDPELGEVNLYGVPPQGDLDIRLVQRKVKDKENVWLYGSGFNCVYGFAKNIDLKKDYRENADWIPDGSRDFVLKVYAKHYPVNVYLVSITNHNSLSSINVNLGAEIAMTTYNEPLDSETGDKVNVDNENYCIFGSYFDVWAADESKSIVNGDTVYPLLAKPQLINRGTNGKSYTFADSSSRNMLLGFNYFFRGTGNVQEANNTIKLYPNPSNNVVIINEGNAGDTYEVINSAGDNISNFAVEVFPYRYDISTIPAGIYYIINTKSGKDFGKFVKE